MRTILSLLVAATMATTAGCFADDSVQYSGGGYAEVDSPDLVEVSPGVQVIADYDEPIFFNEGYYWRYNGGVWYSSSRWGGGWGRVDRPPVVIGRIDRPGAYSHYRPSGWSPRARTGGRAVGRTERGGRVETRTETRRAEPARTETRRVEPARTETRRAEPARAPSSSSSGGHAAAAHAAATHHH